VNVGAKKPKEAGLPNVDNTVIEHLPSKNVKASIPSHSIPWKPIPGKSYEKAVVGLSGLE